MSEGKNEQQFESDFTKQLKQQRREGRIAHLGTMKTLLRQGFAIRGNDDEESNFIQFNRDKAQYIPGLTTLLTENRYMSHSIIEE